MMSKRFLCLLSIAMMTFSVFVIGNGAGSEFRMRTKVTWANASFIGEKAGDMSSMSSFVGDVNGDGYDDLVIGSPYNDDGGTDAGQVYLVLGKGSGWTMDMDLSSASASFLGEDASDYAGCSVSGAGDVNGDGYDDFLIGARGDDDAGSNAGQAYLILGKRSGWAMDTDLSVSSASFVGERAGDDAGVKVSGAGDVNGDGYEDILIGAKYNDDGGQSAGQTYLILGRTSGWSLDTPLSSSNASFWGEDTDDFSSSDLSAAGDVNGDGLGDFLIGADGDDDGGTFAGQTYLILGKTTGWAMDTDLSESSASFWGENTDDQSGISVAGSGDVNSDGYDDFIIGANQNDDGGSGSGKAYLIFGKKMGWSMDIDLSTADVSFIGEEASDGLGNHVGMVGDTNGDGFDDIMVNALGNDFRGTNSGQGYLILGRGSRIEEDLALAFGSFTGEKASNYLSGSEMSGDANGDGLCDILLGSNGNDEGGSDAGQVYLFLSSVGPPGPQDLVISNAQDTAQLTLSWTAPSSWAEPLESYRVYRSLDGSNYDYLGSTKTSVRTYTDDPVAIGITYHYRVVADYGQGDNYFGEAKGSILCDIDTDKDGIGNMADWDDDDDGITDLSDVFPLDSKEWLDSDLDGEGNEADKDDDNDGIEDISDPNPLNPYDPISIKLDALALTIASRFDSLEGDLAELEGEITVDIQTSSDETRETIEGIMDRLEDLNDTLEHGSLSENLTDIRSMLDYESKDSLPALFNLLTDVIAHLKTNLTGLLEDIATGQNDSTSSLNDLERSLEALEDLEAIIDAIETLQGDVDDTEEKVDSNNDLTLYLFILTIAVVCIIGVILLIAVRSGGRKRGRPKDVEE